MTELISQVTQITLEEWIGCGWGLLIGCSFFIIYWIIEDWFKYGRYK